MTQPVLRVFISSPGDVAQERVIAKRVLDRLANRFANVVQVEQILWEHEPLLATDSFQKQIARPSETDIVVTILWSRLGTRLPADITRPDGTPYNSGTEFEFEDAKHGFEQSGSPDLVVYRKTSEPTVSLNDESKLLSRLNQKKSLDEFIRRWFHGEDGSLIAAFHSFDDSGEFEDLLEEHLGKLIERKLEKRGLNSRDKDRRQTVAIWNSGSPFRGLDVFEAEHAPVFFGRTRAIGEVLSALRAQSEQGKAFLLILGMSGCGKSSLIRAGVLPLIKEPGVIEGVGLWRQAVMRPSDSSPDLFKGLASALSRTEALPELGADGTDVDSLAELFRENPRGAGLLVKGALSQAAGQLRAADDQSRQPEARLVLLIDQLEEIFTADGIDHELRSRFIESISSLARSGRCWVITTLRSDFYQHTTRLSELCDLKEGTGQYDLMPPTHGEFAQMIRRPAESAGLCFQEHPETHEKLDDLLRDEACSDPASLPLLEFTLDELYKSRTHSGALTFEAYRDLGGVEGALATRADEVYFGLNQDVQNELPNLFRRLVTTSGSEDESATRRLAHLDDLHEYESLRQLTDAFVAARLLVTDVDNSGLPVVRLTHEALLTHWKPAIQWLENDRELLRIRSRVGRSFDHWTKEHQRADLLLPAGKSLEEANKLISADGFAVTDSLAKFVSASQAKNRKRIRLKRIAVAMLLFLVFATAASALVANRLRILADESAAEAKSQKTIAENETKRADRQAKAALTSKAKAIKNLEIAERNAYNSQMLLAKLYYQDNNMENLRQLLERYRFRDDLRGFEWTYWNTRANSETHTLTDYPFWIRALAYSPVGDRVASAGGNVVVITDVTTGKALHRLDQGHKDFVLGIAFSHDGRRMATGDIQGVITVWDPVKGQKLFSLKDDQAVWCLAFDNHRDRLASTSGPAIKIWDLDQRKMSLLIGRHDEPVNSVCFSPDGQKLASASDDKTVKIWDVANRRINQTLQGHTDKVESVAFSSDGNTIASASEDETIRLWNAKNGEETKVLRGHQGVVKCIAFSQKGDRLVSASYDKTVRLWDVSTGQVEKTLKGHTKAVWCVGIRPDGQKVVSGGDDKTVKIWDLRASDAMQIFNGHTSWVDGVAFGPKGQRLASASWDRSVRVWNVATGMVSLHLEYHGDMIKEVAFDKQGKRIASAGSFDRTARIFDAVTGEEIHLLEGETVGVTSVAFSPNGDLLATGNTDKAIKIIVWNAHSGKKIHSLKAHENSVSSLDFGPNGKRLVSGSGGAGEDTVKVWDVETGKNLAEFKGHTDNVNSVRFSPNGDRIASGSKDKTVIIWNANTGQKELVLKGHTREVKSVAFSPDGKRLASASFDKSIKIWDTVTGQELLTLSGHRDKVTSVSFSPNGIQLASASADQTIRIWGAVDVSDDKKNGQPKSSD